MTRVSPTAEGFRAALRRPALSLAEITWRWAVDATVGALCLFSILEYLDTLPATQGELLMLRSKRPMLVSRALAHILRGSLNRAVMAGLLGMMALTGLWIIVASLGRTFTIRALLEYFASRRCVAGNAASPGLRESAGGDVASNVSTPFGSRRRENVPAIQSPAFRALLGLNFLRATAALAALLGLVGAAILAGLVSPEENPQPGLAFLVFVPLAGVVCLSWWALNWLLSLAAIFSVRDGEDTIGALSAAVTVCRERFTPLLAVTTWFELAHVAAFGVASVAASLPLILLRIAPLRVVIAGVFLIALAYFAVIDWLYMARLAGYVCIAQMPEALAASALQVTNPPQTAIDRDELIISDVPGLVLET